MTERSTITDLVEAVASVDEKVDPTNVLYANAELFRDLLQVLDNKKIGQEEFDAGIDSAKDTVHFFATMFQSMYDLRVATEQARNTIEGTEQA